VGHPCSRPSRLEDAPGDYDPGVSDPQLPQTVALLEQLSESLGDVQLTRAHGCDAVSACGRAYALVVPDGRIAVRLPDWDLFTAAFELPGSEPLYENERRVGHWVLLPGAVRHDVDALGEWLRRAHELTAVDV
jgi:hypothetical protein